MAVGSLSPYPHLQFFDSNGDPLSSGTLEFYEAGTSTPLASYSDVGLLVANPTTITLNAAGRPSVSSVEVGVFLAPRAYKLILKNSAGTTIWTQDNIYAPMPFTGQPGICEGRITLTSNTPVTTSDVTAATTIYFTPYKGNRIALYTNSRWEVSTFSELSLALGSDAADLPYDLFAYDNAGVITLERVAWTNASTRATALTTQDGVYVKTGAVTRRYLGTYRTTGTVGQTEDSLAKRFCWNYYNRVHRPMRVLEATNTWTYTLAAFRQANNSTANQLACVIGVAEVEIAVDVMAHARNSGTTSNAVASIGEDALTTVSGTLVGNQALTTVDVYFRTGASLRKYPAAGYHYYPWLESSAAAGTTTWAGDDGGTILQSGIHGSIEG